MPLIPVTPQLVPLILASSYPTPETTREPHNNPSKQPCTPYTTCVLFNTLSPLPSLSCWQLPSMCCHHCPLRAASHCPLHAAGRCPLCAASHCPLSTCCQPLVPTALYMLPATALYMQPLPPLPHSHLPPFTTPTATGCTSPECRNTCIECSLTHRLTLRIGNTLL